MGPLVEFGSIQRLGTVLSFDPFIIYKEQTVHVHYLDMHLDKTVCTTFVCLKTVVILNKRLTHNQN